MSAIDRPTPTPWAVPQRRPSGSSARHRSMVPSPGSLRLRWHYRRHEGPGCWERRRRRGPAARGPGWPAWRRHWGRDEPHHLGDGAGAGPRRGVDERDVSRGGRAKVGLDEDFDAVVGRWILMHLPDPVAVLHRLLRRLQPGGIVAFQENDFTYPPTAFPPAPLHQRVVRWTTPPPGSGGPDQQMGSKLYRTYLDAGLPDAAATPRRTHWRRRGLARLCLRGRHGTQLAPDAGADGRGDP